MFILFLLLTLFFFGVPQFWFENERFRFFIIYCSLHENHGCLCLLEFVCTSLTIPSPLNKHEIWHYYVLVFTCSLFLLFVSFLSCFCTFPYFSSSCSPLKVPTWPPCLRWSSLWLSMATKIKHNRDMNFWVSNSPTCQSGNVCGNGVLPESNFRNNNKAFLTTSKSIDAHQGMTHDLEKLITNLLGLVIGLVKPTVDILWFTWKTKPLNGQRSFAMLYAYLLLGCISKCICCRVD